MKKNTENSADNVAKKPIMLGLWITAGLFVFFGLWAGFAKIESAAIAPGHVKPNSNKKTIQHLEGGIIEKILVMEGEKVKAGQPLIKLDQTSTKASLALLKKEATSLQIEKIRLEAERDGLKQPAFDIKLDYNPSFAEIIEGEKNLFAIRKKSLAGKIGALNKKTIQLQQQIIGFKVQEKSAAQQIELIEDEMGSVEKLFKKKMISKSRLIALKKEIAKLKGDRGEYIANIAKTKQGINEIKLEIINLKNQRENEITDQLQDIRKKIADLQEKITAALDTLNRTTVTAPQAGIVTGLNFHTQGGVISPGADITDIVPQDDELIIEAKIDPKDIDVVYAGLKARVRLLAYKTKNVPMLSGTVQNVSADRFTDKLTGAAYFVVKIKVDEKELLRLKEVKLYPGMPGECYIVLGSRTFIQYFLSPIADTMRRALKEN
ncbi:MAG: HlyD family type I secretion periplasmic adaptor subunit [Deltaproteobacteria bacterium]|nr:HlyD family type I secretion periplasmic adaptor subunit [Deltaproteobacteria bacterium]